MNVRPESRPSLDGMSLTPALAGSRWEDDLKFGLTANVQLANGRLEAALSYRGDHLSQEQARELAAGLAELLDQFPQALDRPVASLVPDLMPVRDASAAPAPVRPPQYRDAVRLGLGPSGSPADDPGLDFWARYLHDAPAYLPMPVPKEPEEHRSLPVPLTDGVLPRLRALQAEHGVSLYMVAAAALATVLYRWTGQDDIVFGTPVSTREEGFEDVLGPCLNTVVIRCRRGRVDTPAAVLRQVRECVLQAFEHQRTPFERVVDRLNPQRRPSRAPYIDVTLTMESPEGSASLHGLRLDRLEIAQTHETLGKFGLALAVTQTGDQLSVTLNHRGDRIGARDADAFARSLGLVLDAFACAPDRSLATLDLATAAAGPADDGAYGGPQVTVAGMSAADLERSIAAVWREVLSVSHVGSSDNFFDLGGNSMLLSTLHNRLRTELHADLPIRHLFQFPTVGSLAAALAGTAPASEASSDDEFRQRARRGRRSRPAAGRRGWTASERPGRDRDRRHVLPVPGALDAAAYWSALRNGTDGISRFSADELLAAGAPADQVRRPEYVPARGVLGGGDRFDWAYFGYSRADAARIDPQQRVLLECAANALDDAALDPHRFQGWVGVFGGVDSGTPRLEDDGGDVLARMIGREKDYAATRIAYKLGLRGPAVTVQSACSTSLVAVHMACQSLLSYECDAALAGGAALWLPQTRGYLYREGHVLSRDGRCRPFDADATGMLTSSGVGVVVLKRLADALEQGDRVVAVIRGSAINNDGGEKVGFTTPAFAGQRDVIRMAMAQADADPADIRYVEAHGTGTRVGDPIEVAALAAAFGNAPRPEHCWIGSVKSNLGHTGAASGVAGLIKTALMLQGRELVPTLHYQSPNPELRLAETPFRVCAQRGPLAQDGPLLASVSSFGLGGTNAHAVLEAPAVDTRPPARPVPRLFALSAATPGALERLREDTARRLEDADPPRMDDVARTLAVGRREHPHRLAVRAADADGLAVALRETVPSPTVPAATRTAFLFPGQGTLRPGAGRAAYALLPRFREAFDEVAGLAEARFGTRLTTLLDPDTDPGRVRDTGFQHLGLFTLGYALAEQFAAWGVTPEGMLGHSLGEYVAAACAGVWTLPDALALVQERGRVMQEIAEGRMLAVIADRETADSLLGPALDTGKYWVAIDSTDHTVVSGKPEHIAALHTSLEAQEVTTRLLDFDRGAHSPLMDPGTAALRAAVAATTTRGGAPRIVSNLTGAWSRPEDFGDPDYWADHMCGTVRLTDSFGTLLDEGCNVFLELGPGASLSRGVRRHKDWDADGTAVTLLGPSPKEEREALLQALGTLWQRGLPIPLEELAVEPGSMPVSLPPHPLEPSPCTAPSARTTPSGQGPRTTDTPGTGDPLTHERWVQTPAAGAGHHDLVVVAAGPEPGADPGRPPARPRAGTPGDVLTDGFLAALTGADPVGPTVRLGAGELGRVPQAVAEPAATAPLVVVVPDGPADDACTAGLDELADRTEATLLVLAPGAAGFPARGGNGPLTAWADHRARRGGTWPVYVLDPGTGEAPACRPRCRPTPTSTPGTTVTGGRGRKHRCPGRRPSRRPRRWWRWWRRAGREHGTPPNWPPRDCGSARSPPGPQAPPKPGRRLPEPSATCAGGTRGSGCPSARTSTHTWTTTVPRSSPGSSSAGRRWSPAPASRRTSCGAVWTRTGGTRWWWTSSCAPSAPGAGCTAPTRSSPSTPVRPA